MAVVNRQLDSDLCQNHRLVAMDLRGHGLSDQPRDAYADSKLWADDVQAVLEALGLQQPVLTGWSYGPLVILDYIRHYGDEGIGGIHFVGGISKLGSEAALSVLTPEFLVNVPGMLSADAEECTRALDALLDLAFASELTTEDRYMMLGWSLRVPPHVRQALLARAFDNDDLLPTIRRPVLITHSSAETVVKPSAVDEHLAAMPHAEVHWTQVTHRSGTMPTPSTIGCVDSSPRREAPPCHRLSEPHGGSRSVPARRFTRT